MAQPNSRTKAKRPLAELLELAPGRFALRGRLDLDSVPALVRQGKRLFRGARGRQDAQSQGPEQVLEIDLGGVERASSAGIALLLDWVEQAARVQARLVFLNWPDALARIAAFSNVAGLLGLDARSARADS